MTGHLMALGVSVSHARDSVSSTKSTRAAATFAEVYGGGAIVECANKARRNLNLKGLRALDLRTMKDDGTPWNFTLRADRKLARELLDKDDPDWLVGSPPCTAFSIWNYAMNYPKMDRDKVQRAIEEGKTHLNFVVSLYRKQMLKGKYFLHEHPATALSWKEDTVLALIRSPLVHTVVADQCMYGLTTPAEGSTTERLPAMKPTRFMTNSVFMRDQLSLKCDKSHVHQPLVGGRCRDAAFYPLQLVEAILQGMALTADHDAKTIASMMGCRAMEEERKDTIGAVTKAASTIPSTDDEKPVPTSSVKKVAGGVLPIAYHPVQF